MQLFYNDILTPGTKQIVLEGQESRHITHVLRKKTGDLLLLTDGKGGKYTAIITATDKRKCLLEIKEYKLIPPNRNFRIHIAIAPTKNIERMEWFVEKSVEIGVDTISPVLCTHSERKNLKTERLHKKAVSALKQSLQYYLPNIEEIHNIFDFVNQCKSPHKYIAVCEGANQHLFSSIPENSDICILVGPEGGFTREEINKAVQTGFQKVSLGDTRLRTETAGIISIQSIHLKQLL